jgi:hypothetical protein
MVLLLLLALCMAPVASFVSPSSAREQAGCFSGHRSTHLDAAAVSSLVTGKTWGARTFVREHVTLASQLPAYLGAYIGPSAAIEPKLTEAVM